MRVYVTDGRRQVAASNNTQDSRSAAQWKLKFELLLQLVRCSCTYFIRPITGLVPFPVKEPPTSGNNC